MEQNWSDYDACLRRGKFPPVHMHLYFSAEQKKGPHREKQVTNKCRQFPKSVEAAELAYTKARADLHAGGVVDTCAAEALEQLKNDQKTSNLEKARSKAKELLQARKEKRVVAPSPAQ